MSNYPVKETPTVGDQALVWDVTNNIWRRTPLSAVQTLFNETTGQTPLYEAYTQRVVPADGGTVVAGDGLTDQSVDIHIIIRPAATIATATLVLPAVANLRDKQTIMFNTTQEITLLTMDFNGASNEGWATGILAQSAYVTLKYDLATTTWYRVG